MRLAENQTAFAQRLSISRCYLSELECGRRNPSPRLTSALERLTSSTIMTASQTDSPVCSITEAIRAIKALCDNYLSAKPENKKMVLMQIRLASLGLANLDS